MTVIVTADSSCDVTAECMAPIPFELFPLTIIQDGIEYKDGVDIHPEEIYARVQAGAPVPTTSAVNLIDYAQRFELLSQQYDAVIHISLGSAISSCYEHACMAAKSFPNVYIIDSKNISLGSGLLLLEAKRMLLEGAEPESIVSTLTDMARRVEFYFLVDQLSFLQKGGRCSNLASLGANLLKLKPCLSMDEEGVMSMVKKYRGAMEKILPSFYAEYLKDRQDIEVESTRFITTSCPDAWIDLSLDEIERCIGYRPPADFFAGCTICSHSGPRALGLAILRK